jgi:NAD(P)-dependent dehydrogenase (short-subunit alcohol dehydrogenase family)
MADDRVALITGAGSGIGLASARLLAGQGLKVVLAGRRAELLEQGASAIAADGGTAHAVVADLAQRDAPARLVADVLDRAGRLDVIVNNAASYLLRPIAEFTSEAFDDHIAVNVRAPYFLVQAALPALRASPAAVVVNVSSAAAVMYRPGQTVYGLTKAALEHLTMNLASELAADGIRVVAVRPGPVATELHARAVADPDARLRAIAAMVPLQRLGTADEVALWIGHLVDARAAWVTGTIIAVDGGRILGSPGV